MVKQNNIISYAVGSRYRLCFSGFGVRPKDPRNCRATPPDGCVWGGGFGRGAENARLPKC